MQEKYHDLYGRFKQTRERCKVRLVDAHTRKYQYTTKKMSGESASKASRSFNFCSACSKEFESVPSSYLSPNQCYLTVSHIIEATKGVQEQFRKYYYSPTVPFLDPPDTQKAFR